MTIMWPIICGNSQRRLLYARRSFGFSEVEPNHEIRQAVKESLLFMELSL
jgi:hypothetical protein